MPEFPSRRRRGRLVLGLLAALAGCAREAEPVLQLPEIAPSELRAETFSVLSFHFGDAFVAPAPGRLAAAPPEAIRYLAFASPDILVLHGMGRDAAFRAFLGELAAAGVPYPHAILLEGHEDSSSLAVLSRHPPVLRQIHTNDTYRISDTEFRIEPGTLDLTYIIDGRALLRLFAAGLVDKTFHPLGQAEMRRNEARLLAQRVGRGLRDQPDLPILVACALHDVRDSAPFRELTERRSELMALDPRDPAGNAWTWRAPDGAAHHAHDFFFASTALAALVDPEQTLVVDAPDLLGFTPHRPLLATFRLEP